MKKSLLIGLCIAFLYACGGGGSTTQTPPPPSGPTASEQLFNDLQGLNLADYYTTSIAALVQRSPETVIWRSLLDVYPPAVPLLDNLSDAFQRETFAMYQVTFDALRTYDRTTLASADQLNYDAYEWYLQDVIDRLPFIYYDYPATYGVFGVPRDTEQLFTEVHPIDSLQDAQDYVTRLGHIETKFAQLADHLEMQQQNGVVEPALTMQVAINQITAMVQGDSLASPYYTALVEKMANHPGITDAQRTDLAGQALAAADGSIRRGYQSLLTTLQGLLPTAPASIGVGQFPNGSAYYDFILRHHTTTDLTAAQIHQLGLDQLARIKAEMRVIFDDLGYPGYDDATLQELFALVEIDGTIIPAANVKSTYETIIDLAKQNVGDAFDIFPTADVVVIGGPFGGYYIGPSKDGSRPGAFYAGTTRDEPWSQMRTLAYHEAIPGHHTQIAIALDQDMPIGRQVARSSAFIEGWGLYAERLAWELGWHDNDPYSNLGRLQYEALRAARLVMDTGIHSLGWSFDYATQFNQDNVGVSTGASQSSAGRYSVIPGQATAYMVGMLQILSERQRAMDELGAQFDIKAFHRALLTNGSLPLALMDTVVDQYIVDALAVP
jgi:uncharacterized protein (DUF885 family)